MSSYFKIAGLVVLTLVIVLGSIMAVAGFRGVTAPFFGRQQAEVQIEGAGSRIARYEAFFGLCSAVEGYEDQLAVLENQLENTDTDDRDEINRLNQTIAGLEGQRARAIREYNQDARMEYTAARFHSSDLPYQLSIDETNNCSIN